MEFLRGDPRGAAAGVSTSQWIGLVLVGVGIVWLWIGFRRSQRNPLPEVTPA
jgi:hypothetical protein